MPSFTTTAHEAATIARAGIGGTVAIVRRLKVQPDDGWHVTLDDTACGYAAVQHGPFGGTKFLLCPSPLSPGKPVWVKEVYGWRSAHGWAYPAGIDDERYDEAFELGELQWNPAVTIPKRAARHTLTPETVRVCRVQDVTEDEAFETGIETDLWHMAPVAKRYDAPSGWFVGWSMGVNPPNIMVEADEVCRRSFNTFWTAQHGPDAWDRNDWVMVALCKIGDVK